MKSTRLNADEAWQIYCERGVIAPGFASEIARRRDLMDQWDEVNECLR